MVRRRKIMTATVLESRTRAFWVFGILLCLIIGAPASGRGILPIGGQVSIGVSAGLLPWTPSRPLPPIASLLLDETHETVFPIGSGVPLATWDSVESGSARLILKANIVWDDPATGIVTADDIIACWTARASERWDARWALRGIAGIEDNAPQINGLAAIDERTLTLTLRAGMNSDNLQKALTSPALGLSLPGSPSSVSSTGTGPFLVAANSGDRETLVHSNAHHAGRAYLDQVGVIAYPSADESAVDFGRGSLDALLITSNEQEQYAATSRAETGRVEIVGQSLLVLLLNPARLPTLEERRSLALAADRDGIAAVVLGGNASPASDFQGGRAEPRDWTATFEEARRLYSQAEVKRDRIVLLVCDDPAAREAAGRLRANWETLGVPIEIRTSLGPLMLSLEADAVLLALRIPSGGEGVLPQCLALYDRSSWWETAAMALGTEKGTLLRSVRALQPDADFADLETSMDSSALAVPLARYEIMFAPGPDVSLAPEFVYPGPTFWRAFKGVPPQ